MKKRHILRAYFSLLLFVGMAHSPKASAALGVELVTAGLQVNHGQAKFTPTCKRLTTLFVAVTYLCGRMLTGMENIEVLPEQSGDLSTLEGYPSYDSYLSRELGERRNLQEIDDDLKDLKDIHYRVNPRNENHFRVTRDILDKLEDYVADRNQHYFQEFQYYLFMTEDKNHYGPQLLANTQEVRRKMIYAEMLQNQRRRELGADFMRDIAVDFNEFWELDDDIPDNYKKILVNENYDPLTDVEATVCTLPLCPGGSFSPYAEGVAFAFILAFETFLFVSCCYCLFMPFSEKLFEGCSEIQGACCGVIACRYCNFCLDEVLECVEDCIECKQCNCCFPDPPFTDPSAENSDSPCRCCFKICSLHIATAFENELPKWYTSLREKFKVKKYTRTATGEGSNTAQEEASSSQESDSEEEKTDSSEDSEAGDMLFTQGAQPITLLYRPSANQSEVQMQPYSKASKKGKKRGQKKSNNTRRKPTNNNLIEEESDRTQNL